MYKRKTGVLLYITSVFLIMFLTACGNNAESSESSAPISNNSGVEKQITAELKPFSIGYLPSTGHLLYFVAQEEGFFAKEGLDVTLQLFDSGKNMLSVLESGKLDAGALGTTETVSYLQQGYDLSIIGGIMKEGHALLVKPEVVEGVAPEDYSLELLRGKRIAVVPIGTQDIIWRVGLKEAGLEVGTDVEFVDVESGSSAYAALNNADIDGALVFTPFRAQGVNDGYVILNYSGQVEGFANHPCCRNVAENEKINADPDAYRAYLKALIEAYKFYQENEDKTVDDIIKYVDLDREIIYQETYGECISSNPDPEKTVVTDWKNYMVEIGYTEDFDIESSINVTLYKEALDEVIAENPDEAFYQAMADHYEEFDK